MAGAMPASADLNQLRAVSSLNNILVTVSGTVTHGGGASRQFHQVFILAQDIGTLDSLTDSDSNIHHSHDLIGDGIDRAAGGSGGQGHFFVAYDCFRLTT
jgi:hypothetical protein